MSENEDHLHTETTATLHQTLNENEGSGSGESNMHEDSQDDTESASYLNFINNPFYSQHLVFTDDEDYARIIDSHEGSGSGDVSGDLRSDYLSDEIRNMDFGDQGQTLRLLKRLHRAVEGLTDKT